MSNPPDAAPLSVEELVDWTQQANKPFDGDLPNEDDAWPNEDVLRLLTTIAQLTADNAALESKRRLADQLKVNALERADALEIRATTAEAEKATLQHDYDSARADRDAWMLAKEAAEASLAVVVEALKPFAEEADRHPPPGGFRPAAEDTGLGTPRYKLSALIAARDALASIPTAAQDLLVNQRTPGFQEHCPHCNKPPHIYDVNAPGACSAYWDKCPLRTASKET